MPSAPILWKKLQTSQRLNPTPVMDSYNISEDATELFRQRLQNQIATAAKRFAKTAARSLDALSGSFIYKDLKSSAGRHAALITELFRNAHFISNSGSLDTIPCIQLLGRRYGRTLPQHLTGCLQAGGNVSFESLYLIEGAIASFHIPELSDAPLGVTTLPEADAIPGLSRIHLFDDVELS